MGKSLLNHWGAQFLIAFFIFFTSFWLIITLLLPKDHYLYQVFGATYGILALWGGIWGIVIANKWGGIKSVMGKALIFFSLGLFAQEFGQVMYSYYLYFQKIEVPYPSLGDVGYFGSIPLYILGVLYLAKASGVKIGLSSFVNKIQAILIPGVILVLSYYFFMQGYVPDWSAPIRTLLDFGYPLGQAIYISLALLTYSLSRGVLGGVMKPRILFILFALFVQYIADFSFLYLAQQGQAYPGSILDYAYILAYFLMGIGLLQFGSVLTKLREK